MSKLELLLKVGFKLIGSIISTQYVFEVSTNSASSLPVSFLPSTVYAVSRNIAPLKKMFFTLKRVFLFLYCFLYFDPGKHNVAVQIPLVSM